MLEVRGDLPHGGSHGAHRFLHLWVRDERAPPAIGGRKTHGKDAPAPGGGPPAQQPSEEAHREHEGERSDEHPGDHAHAVASISSKASPAELLKQFCVFL
jgi:hypothetical protein